MKLFTYFFIFLIKGLFTLKKLKINSCIDLNDTGVLKSLNYSTLLPLPDQKYFINDDKIFNFDASKLNINFNFYKKQIGYLLENKSKENYISINSENYELIEMLFRTPHHKVKSLKKYFSEFVLIFQNKNFKIGLSFFLINNDYQSTISTNNMNKFFMDLLSHNIINKDNYQYPFSINISPLLQLLKDENNYYTYYVYSNSKIFCENNPNLRWIVSNKAIPISNNVFDKIQNMLNNQNNNNNTNIDFNLVDNTIDGDLQFYSSSNYIEQLNYINNAFKKYSFEDLGLTKVEDDYREVDDLFYADIQNLKKY